tara:strand:- start:187 stop:1278 length:1092 start_codon:yes stop_codon:yes gene_type:complete
MIQNKQKIIILGPEGTDISLFIAFISLHILSWATLFNVSGTFSFDISNPLTRQMSFSLLALILFFLMSYFSLDLIQSLCPLLYTVSISLLVLLLFTDPNYGVRRWFSFGILDFQPSEFAKIINVLFVAYLLSRTSFPKYYSFLSIALTCLLIYQQPDLGTVLIIAITYFIIMFTSNISTLSILSTSFISICSFFALIQFNLMPDYQIGRITNFISGFGIGDFSQQQSRLAISSGGLTGRGSQSMDQYGAIFVPVKTTDFIFSSFAESFGLIGILLLVSIWLFLFYKIYINIKLGKDLFSKFALIGIFSLLCVQMLLNIGISIGFLPVTGLPFPLLSLGGSAISANAITFGLLNRFFIENRLYI